MTKKKKQEAYLELDRLTDDRIVLKGQELRVRWIDSYLLVWSATEHPYDKE